MKKLEFTPDDIRSGTRAMMDKIVEAINSKAAGVNKTKLDEIEELDVEKKLTNKDVAEAFNKILQALKS